jgi:hypothetical protein
MSGAKVFFTGEGAAGRIAMVAGLVVVFALAVAGVVVASTGTSGAVSALSANQEMQSRGSAVIYGNIGVPACPYYCNNPNLYPEILNQAPFMRSWRGATSLSTDATLLGVIDGENHGLCTCVEDPRHPFASMSNADQIRQFQGDSSWNYVMPPFQKV